MKRSSVDRSDDRSIVINFRASAKQKDIVDRAAQTIGKTRTDFILEASCQAAREVLLDQRLFSLDEERFQSFIDRLDEPAQVNEGVRNLMRKTPKWKSQES